MWQLSCKEWNLDTLETSSRFGWTAYWGGACSPAAAPPAVNSEELLRSPVKPYQGSFASVTWATAWVQLGGKNLALIFKILSNDSLAHMLSFNFFFCEKQGVGGDQTNVQPRLSRVELFSWGNRPCLNLPFLPSQTDPFQFGTLLLILLLRGIKTG